MRCAKLFLSCLSITFVASAASAQYEVTSSSFFGGSGADSLRAVVLLSDGAIVVAGDSSSDPEGASPLRLAGAGESGGILAFLTADGRGVVSSTRVPGAVWDLAVDAEDRLYVASGDAGLLVLSADGSEVLWRAEVGHVHRVSVAGGRVAALVPSEPGDAETSGGSGTVHVFDTSGTSIGSFAGHRNTLDIALDTEGDNVILVGWRQANASDGSATRPVQIAYLRSVALDGTARWTAYDWSTDTEAADFLNRPENNMADTRGYRVSVGPSGRVYAGFECAGGNHIFRYDPFDVSTRVNIVGGDRYHEFSNTRSEHKTFMGIYDADTGAYQTGQQLTGRLSSGAGNTVRVRSGEITTDESGRVYLAGTAASGLPLSFTPPDTGEYTGGAYLVVMSSDLSERLYVTRIDPGGSARQVAARSFEGQTTIALVGETSEEGDETYATMAFQETYGGAVDGFVTVFGAEAGPTEPSDAGPRNDAGSMDGGGDVGRVQDGGDDAAATGEPSGDGGCGCRAGGLRTDSRGALTFFAFALAFGLRRRRNS